MESELLNLALEDIQKKFWKDVTLEIEGIFGLVEFIQDLILVNLQIVTQQKKDTFLLLH